MEQDYIKNLRKKVGHEPLILNFAGGVLVNDQDEILLQKRSDFKSWGLPGGAMEFGESCQEACVREFLEETGLKVKVKSLLGISTEAILRPSIIFVINKAPLSSKKVLQISNTFWILVNWIFIR